MDDPEAGLLVRQEQRARTCGTDPGTLSSHLFCWGSWLFTVKAGVGLWWDAPAAAVLAAAIAFASSALFFVPAGYLGFVEALSIRLNKPAGAETLSSELNSPTTPGSRRRSFDDDSGSLVDANGSRKPKDPFLVQTPSADLDVFLARVINDSDDVVATQEPVVKGAFQSDPDFIRALCVLLGCSLFGACNLTGLVGSIVPMEDILFIVFFWVVEILGSCSFIVSGVLAIRDPRTPYLSWGWQSSLWNFMGGAGFLVVGVLGIYSYAPGADVVSATLAYRANTLAAGVAFGIGGALRLIEIHSVPV